MVSNAVGFTLTSPANGCCNESTRKILKRVSAAINVVTVT